MERGCIGEAGMLLLKDVLSRSVQGHSDCP